ncbi:MAG: peptide-methionine (R)-S-oxide reductase MsrB [Flavobacteriaceae bacterium]|nr:peptide-methionine (R)-S-oxide reductase MsrB [Flavobacteriaceae bacterium]
MKEVKELTWKDVIHYATKGNPAPDRRVEKTPEEWKEILSPQQFKITRLKGTESPHSGALCSIYEPGKYACVCCHTLLFDSGLKFESGTGWPSFTQPIAHNAIKYEKDSSFGMIRVEVLCNTCDAHLGHIFPDGPAPSGLRYCVNSESLILETDIS